MATVLQSFWCGSHNMCTLERHMNHGSTILVYRYPWWAHIYHIIIYTFADNMETNRNLCVGRVIALGHLENYIISWPPAGVHFIWFMSFLLISVPFHQSIVIMWHSRVHSAEYHKMIITDLVNTWIRNSPLFSWYNK